MKMKQMRVRRVAKTTLTGLILVGFACLIGTANAQGLGCAHELDEETSNKALRFARGEEVLSNSGQPAKLSRPLDWVVISDHSDMAGTIFSIRDGDPEFMRNPIIIINK